MSDLRFPQPFVVKDFTDVFRTMPESILFTFENDPYSSQSQPYVGDVTVTISVGRSLPIEAHHELFLLLTTRSLFEGPKYIEGNLEYISRYVYLFVGSTSYTFQNVHPGMYHPYSYNDVNNDGKHTRGDYTSSDTSKTVNLPPNGSVTVEATIDLVIP
ncbi:MAG: hypothetical protein JXB46_10330 [Candidatus Eisenbacteria bacterium]|nr:hypothetical protein [Candidatus Eisenbacteria bacterium]